MDPTTKIKIETPRSGLVKDIDGITRCFWCVGHDDYRHYHDTEWGKPVTDDRLLFEMLTLEGFQSGLNWLIILRKRNGFKEAFDNFDASKIARYGKKDVTRLLKNEGIVRHRAKIEAVINNAKRAEELVRECGSLASFFWSFEPDSKELPKHLNWDILRDMAKTDHSVALSKALKSRGWSYVGPTAMYAFMQAVGIVNDHMRGCAAHKEVEQARERFKRPALCIVGAV